MGVTGVQTGALPIWQVVERRGEIRVPLEPTRRDWPRLLGELAGQLDDGRVYDRDLPALGRALEPVLQAYRRLAPRRGAPDFPLACIHPCVRPAAGWHPLSLSWEGG